MLSLRTALPRTRNRASDLGLAVLVLTIVAMMVIPLPTFLLDLLITLNIASGVMVLLAAMYAKQGLELSSFPTLLLLTTLYRLALNVSSTRLILLQADAGEVISAFGNFVVQGNYAVGGVIFLVLTIIQFIVIAKGSERVAEVGARFTLDAMPGKQMSIDSELRSGAISSEDARTKRTELSRESQFYGAMDGAMKFVKGDAIAGIVMTVINLVAGVGIGVGMRGLDAQTALGRYGLLTIGDGLVSQIPALLISTAAGLVVTRVASASSESTLGSELYGQLFAEPRTLAVGAAFLMLLALVPGLPTLPFVLIGIAAGVAALKASQRAAEQTSATLGTSVNRHALITVRCARSIGVTTARLRHEVAQAMEEHWGVPLLSCEVTLDAALPPNHIALDLSGLLVGTLMHDPTRMLALSPAPELQRLGFAAVALPHPLTSLPVATLASDAAGMLEAQGIAALDPVQTLATRLVALLGRRIPDCLGLQETRSLLDEFERTHPALVRHVVPKPVPLATLAQILRSLLADGLSLRPLRDILEALSSAKEHADTTTLIELARQGLRRHISHRFAPSGKLAVFVVDPMIEESIRDGQKRGDRTAALSPRLVRDIVEAFARRCDKREQNVALVHADVRSALAQALATDFPWLSVLAYDELLPELEIESRGRISV